MFVHINPEPASAQESLCSLKFAAKVNGCETAAKGGARRNVTSGAAPQLSAQVWGMVGPNCVSSCVCVCVCVCHNLLCNMMKPGTTAGAGLMAAYLKA
jgi:hypothetical protein